MLGVCADPSEVQKNNEPLEAKLADDELVFDSVHDITDLKRTEKKLRTYLLAMESSVDGIAICDLEGRFTFMNQAHAEMFGYSGPEFFIGKPWTILYDEAEKKIWKKSFADFMAAGRWRGETTALKKDGTKFPQEVSLTAIPSGEIVCVCRDISLRKQSEKTLCAVAEDLIRSNKELEQFAYVASHDLQEPMRMIASYVELLSEDFKGRLTADSAKHVEFILNAVERMRLLIRDLLAYSCVGKESSADAENISCNDVIRVVQQNLEKLIELSGAKIVSSDLPVIRASASELTQLFQNIIENAIKYRSERIPEIQIKAERGPVEWIFSVTDNGIGFDPAHHDRIFKIFQRLHQNKSDTGSGIGLAIAKKIVERYGGRIWADSERGKGSVFYFTAPIDCEVPSFGAPDSSSKSVKQVSREDK